MEIRALQEGDERSPFRSGDPDLDRFFHRFARQNQFKNYLGVTYVAVDAGRILGFATLAPGHVEIEGLPATARKKLPRYPLPVLRLARLAVDQVARGQGLGRQLLRFVLQLALGMARDYGCVGVAVDAKPDAVEFYEQYGFVSVDVVEGQSDARPAPIPMFLTTRAIQEGRSARSAGDTRRRGGPPKMTPHPQLHPTEGPRGLDQGSDEGVAPAARATPRAACCAARAPRSPCASLGASPLPQ